PSTTSTLSLHDALPISNYAAGQLLFLASRFKAEATSETPSLDLVRRLSGTYGNTMTATLWRLAEQAHGDRPIVALVTGHPHPAKDRKSTRLNSSHSQIS